MKSKMKTRIEYVGALELGNYVDVTDPCYNRDVWCRRTLPCVPGLYTGYVEFSDEGDWGTRVARLSIFKDDKKRTLGDMKSMGTIGVDAGLAGFFNNKPDFNVEEWSKFVNDLGDLDGLHKTYYWNLYNGIFSCSGYGDGVYEVYASEKLDAFTIVFI